MDVLLYIKMMGAAGKRLQETLGAVSARAQMEVFRTIDSLSKRLCQPLKSQAIVILVISVAAAHTALAMVLMLMYNRRYGTSDLGTPITQ